MSAFDSVIATLDPAILGIAVAIGIGLLIGLEREHRKGEGATRAPAGLRTFAVSSLAGAIGFALGGRLLLAIVTAGVIVLVATAYLKSRNEDPGLTSEVALVLTVLLGGLAMQRPALAAGLAVVLTILLAARSALHDFVRGVLSETEIRDGLIFAGMALVALPLLPDRPVDPSGVLVPRNIGMIVILVMAIGAFGHVSIRLFGARIGLPIAGLASGFVSSTATIGAMGSRASREPQLLGAAVAGATLSTVATVAQLIAILALTSLPVLRAMLAPLVCAGVAALLYGAVFTFKAAKEANPGPMELGRAFSLTSALMLAGTISGVLLASAVLRDRFGNTGVAIGAALAGFADTHAPAVAVASLGAAGDFDAVHAVTAILAAMSTNTVSKALIACINGGRRFAMRLIPGLAIVIASAWGGATGLSWLIR